MEYILLVSNDGSFSPSLWLVGLVVLIHSHLMVVVRSKGRHSAKGAPLHRFHASRPVSRSRVGIRTLMSRVPICVIPPDSAMLCFQPRYTPHALTTSRYYHNITLCAAHRSHMLYVSAKSPSWKLTPLNPEYHVVGQDKMEKTFIWVVLRIVVNLWGRITPTTMVG